MKAIINRLYCGLLVPLVLLASAACAHTEAETNAVAKSMLEFVLLSVNDNLDDVADGVEQESTPASTSNHAMVLSAVI